MAEAVRVREARRNGLLFEQAGGQTVDTAGVFLGAVGGHAFKALLYGVVEQGFAFAGVGEKRHAEAARRLNTFDLDDDELAFAGERGAEERTELDPVHLGRLDGTAAPVNAEDERGRVEGSTSSP